MDYKKLTESMEELTNEHSITDILMCIELKLCDKVDEANEVCEEAKLNGTYSPSLLVPSMRLRRLLSDVSTAKNTALLVE
mgnify:CR=1 FL=1